MADAKDWLFLMLVWMYVVIVESILFFVWNFSWIDYYADLD